MNFQKYILNQMYALLDLSSKRIYSVKSTDMEEDIEVAPGIFQSKEDYEANMAFDEARDNEL